MIRINFPFDLSKVPPTGSVIQVVHPALGSDHYVITGTISGGGTTSLSLEPLSAWEGRTPVSPSAIATCGDRVIRPNPGETVAEWIERVRVLMSGR